MWGTGAGGRDAQVDAGERAWMWRRVSCRAVPRTDSTRVIPRHRVRGEAREETRVLVNVFHMRLANIEGVDFGRTSEDYAKYRPGFPDSFFERLAGHGVGLSGQRILDLGTGTGTLARGFARRGASVVGLDLSSNQMGAAAALDLAAGVKVEYRIGNAEATGMPDASFNVVSAGQCWHWFDSMVTMAEVRRLLRPRGKLVIAHFDWLPLPGNVVEATEQLIRAHNPSWEAFGRTGIYPQWAVDAGRAGFRDTEIFAYEHAQVISHEAWRGRIRASAGVGASLSPEAVAQFDAEFAELLRARFPEEPLRVPHRVFALVAVRPE